MYYIILVISVWVFSSIRTRTHITVHVRFAEHPRIFSNMFHMWLYLPAVLNDAINQSCCPLVGDRGVDLNFVSIAVHPFCARAVCSKSDIYGIWIIFICYTSSIPILYKFYIYIIQVLYLYYTSYNLDTDLGRKSSHSPVVSHLLRCVC